MVQFLKIADNLKHLIVVYRKEEIEDSLFRYRVLHKILDGNYNDDPHSTLEALSQTYANKPENLTASIFSANNGVFADFEDLVEEQKKKCEEYGIKSFTVTKFLDSGSMLNFESLQSFLVNEENDSESTENTEDIEDTESGELFARLFENITETLKEKSEVNVKPLSDLFDTIFGGSKIGNSKKEEDVEEEENPAIYNNIFYSYEYGNKDRAFEEDDRKKNSFYHGLTSAEYFKFLKELQKIQVEHKASVKKLHTDYLDKQKELEIEKLRKRDQAYEDFVRKARG